MTAVAFFDCPSGVSGDMILGALLDAGLNFDALRAALEALPIDGYALTAEPVTRGPLGATHARIHLTVPDQPQRRLRDVLAIIEGGALPDTVRQSAAGIFTRLAEAEAHVHRVAIDEIHFHEVGAIDAIVDVVGACLGLHLLGIEEVYASPLPLARGVGSMAHGRLPLPAPAVLELLARAAAPTLPHDASVELVTPTGAAILTTLARFEQPPMRIRRIGYGAGSREEPAPNLLRLWLGQSDDAKPQPERLMVLEANIDDMPGEMFGHAVERLLAAGALDAWCIPLTMKKSRPAAMLCALCMPESRGSIIDIIMRETSTFGVRVREVTRYAAARELREVETPFGEVRVKLKLLDGVVVGASPEYDDCRRLAVQGAPLPQVYAAAIAAAAPFIGLALPLSAG